MGVASLVSDPDFQKLNASDQQAAMSGLDPSFGQLSPTDFSSVVTGIQKNVLKRPDVVAPPSIRNPVSGSIPPASMLPNTGEGPIAQGLTTFERKLSDMPGQIWDAAKASRQSLQDMQAGKTPPPLDVKSTLKGLNPIATNEGSLPMNIGATAANVLPWMIDPEGGGITNSPIAKLASLPKAALDAIPSTAKAGQLFEATSKAAGKIPVDVSAPGKVALDSLDLAQSGGQMPKVMRDFLRRTSDPNLPPLTYDEARKFASNASRLSADETNRLTPVMKRQAAQFSSALGDSNQNAAATAGAGDTYNDAMSTYRKAARIRDAKDFVSEKAVPALVNNALKGAGLGLGGALTYGLYREVK